MLGYKMCQVLMEPEQCESYLPFCFVCLFISVFDKLPSKSNAKNRLIAYSLQQSSAQKNSQRPCLKPNRARAQDIAYRNNNCCTKVILK